LSGVPANQNNAPLSPVEAIKAESRLLRGTIASSLEDPATGGLAEADTHLLKFHGSYQQDDRDVREERRQRKLEPAFSFMIRTRLPGGVCTPRQWLALDDLATRFANGSLRLTTRQAFQLHGVIKGNLKTTIAAMNAALIDTIAACGDVNRNVLVSANPLASDLHAIVYGWAVKLSEHLLPRTRAYHEIWLDGRPVAGGEEQETIYGPSYLPRKFKTALVVPPVNDVDVFAQDLGFIAIASATHGPALLGFNVTAGGGLGATHGDAATYPRLADTLGFIEPEQLLAVAEAVVTTQRDFGDRSNRKHARLKYTVEAMGVDEFRREVERRAGIRFRAAKAVHFTTQGDGFGWARDVGGAWSLTLRIPAGRIADREGQPWRTGMRAIAAMHRGSFRLTPNQNLIIAGVDSEDRAAIEALVRRHALSLHETASPVQLHALACVALPTCPLAMAEAERYLPTLIRGIEQRLKAHGLEDDPLSVRITGCPNGCARPYLAEIALVGKAPGRYNLHLGGDASGQRLNRLYRENLDETELFHALEPLLQRYAAERFTAERFGDFLWRSALI
jgi:sulfite reductase (NADPH) hemoprotein beta-component